jgi:hypothetical protein
MRKAFILWLGEEKYAPDRGGVTRYVNCAWMAQTAPA